MLILGVMISGLSGCSFHPSMSNDPKIRLQEYISKTFVIKSVSDREALLGYLGGDAHQRLATWTDEQFREAFIDSKREFVRLVFSDIKPVSSQRVDITYELTYLDQKKGSDAKVTNKKLAELDLTDGKWMISDVRNIKQLIEYRDEMSLP